MDTTKKEIAHNIFLYRHETEHEIYYELDNGKYKVINLTMDFNGSENLTLTTNGNTIRTVIPPYKRVVVAVLKVQNVRRTSQLRVKYTWEEQDPQSPPSTAPKKEELSPGIFLHTKRTTNPDSFLYSVSYNKSGSQLRFTINFSGSRNLYFDNGSLSKTVRVDPYQKVKLGILRPKIESNPWTLKTKYTWSEETKQPQQRRPMPTVYKPPPAQYHAAPLPTHTSPVPSSSFSPAPPSTRYVQAPPPPNRVLTGTTSDIKRQTIADKIDLTTTRVDDIRTGHSSFTFEIDNMKYKNLNVHLDFNGSTNLLLENGQSTTNVLVSPYERRIVGVLRTVTASGGWSLKQKVSVEQLEPTTTSQTTRVKVIAKAIPKQEKEMSARDKIMAASKKTNFYRRASLDRGTVAPRGPPPGVNGNGNGNGNGNATPPVLALLEEVGLKQYWPLFLAEAMDDLDMLRSMATDKIGFREAMKEMGIARMGHREALLNMCS